MANMWKCFTAINARFFYFRAAIRWYFLLKNLFLYMSQSRSLCYENFHLLVFMSDSFAFLSSLSLLPGHIPAQEAKCFSERKWDIFSSVSAIKSSTTLVLQLGVFFGSSSTFLYWKRNSLMRSKSSSTSNYKLSIVSQGLPQVFFLW